MEMAITFSSAIGMLDAPFVCSGGGCCFCSPVLGVHPAGMGSWAVSASGAGGSCPGKAGSWSSSLGASVISVESSHAASMELLMSMLGSRELPEVGLGEPMGPNPGLAKALVAAPARSTPWLVTTCVTPGLSVCPRF